MKIALLGYGKMGHAVERHALERGHEVVARVDAANMADIDSEAFRSADAVVEFTSPASAVANYRRVLPAGIPLVSGTTGWTADRAEVERLVAETGNSMFWTSNFSIGVSLFRAINRFAASIMGGFPQYAPRMKEIHHIHKLDHPSGTAITLADEIMAANPRVNAWSEDPSAPEGTVVIDHVREGEVPGTHIVSWSSPVDVITLEHRALSRDGFALGAVVAAEWLVKNPHPGKITSMEDLMADILGHA